MTAAPEHLYDQIDAASTETRQLMSSVFGGRTPSEPSTWAQDFLDSRLHHKRCPHLQARPLQPNFLEAWDDRWLCRPCTLIRTARRELAVNAGTYRGLGLVEENTCDGCRRLTGHQALRPVVIRINHWVITCGLCKRCVRRANGDP